MFIEDIIMLGKKVWKDNILKSKQVTLSQRFKSLSQASTETTYFFPIAASENLTSDELLMMGKMFERNYAVFTRTAFSLIPFVNQSSSEFGIREHLSKVHQNIGMMPAGAYRYSLTLNSAVDANINYGVLNENNASKGLVDHLKKNVTNLAKDDKVMRPNQGENIKNVAIDYDWKKANEVLPTTVIIPMRLDDHTIELPVHIKANMHKIPTSTMVQDIVTSISEGRGFLNFVKYVSGEQKSLVDFLFGISSMKEDILKHNTSPWLDAFKRRKRLANLAWGVVADNYKPIGTIVLTMNEVNILKNQYDLDVFKLAKKIMNQYFLLGFTILDQTNEIAYVLFDSYPDFQEYPYKALEREASNQDKTLRDMIRAMGRI